MNCPITNLAWGQHIHLCPWCHSLSSAQGLHPCSGPFSLYNNQFASLYSIIPNLQACYDVCLPKNKKNSNTSCPSSHSPITLLETKSLTIYPVFNSSPPLFSWTHCTKTLLVKVTNDYRINKSNSLFLVLISPSTVFIIWLSMTILDSSPISEVGNHFLSEFRRHCYTYLFYMGHPRAWMLVPFSISSLTALNKNLGVISVWMVSPVPISPLNSRLIY